MITICLDESGKFENAKYKKKFVGGLIYTGNDYEQEKERLEDFFKNECKENNLPYPQGIHTTEMNAGATSTEKFMIVENLKKYLKGNGKYYFTFIIKSPDSRKDYANISNMVKDSVGSNLYEHMICELINNIIFYNMNFTEDNYVNLELATRVASVQEYDIENLKAYRQLGYQEKRSNSGYIFYLTNQRTYKAAISTKMMESKIKKAVNFKNVNVECVNYRNDGQTTPYLYLADFACDILRDMLSIEINDFNIVQCHKNCLSITGNAPLLWAYDDIDSLWDNLITDFENFDLIGCLENIYKIKNHKSPFSNYYMDYWVKGINKETNRIFIPDKINVYLSSIEYLFSKNISAYDKGLFMGLELWKLIQANSEIEKKYIYRTSDLILRGYNHIGDSQSAYDFYKICEEYKSNVDVVEYIATVNRIIEIDANEFNFDGAIKKLEDSIICLDVLKKTKQEIAELMSLETEKSSKLTLRGKALSSAAQFYAFKRDYNKALGYFEMALEEYEKPSIDRSITLSYILHLAIDKNDLELYKKYSGEYFETDDLEQQFEKIIVNNNEKRSQDYKLYVYIKALNVFYGKIINKNLIKKIQEADYNSYGFKINSHPWELIYKHIGIILYKNHKGNAASRFMEKAVNAISNKGITIDLINTYTEIKKLEYEKVYENISKKENEKIDKDIMFRLEGIKYMVKNNKNVEGYFATVFLKDNFDSSLEELEEKFAYMYV